MITISVRFLQINHIDVLFNCEPGKLLVDAGLSNDTIVVSENEQSSLANCICPYDLSYRIGPLHYDQYVITIQRDGYVYTEFSIDFNSSTYGIFEID